MESNKSNQIEGSKKLQEIRTLMTQNKYDAYIVPHSDRHDVNIVYYKNKMAIYRTSI